jgi:hypothetical protein
VPVPGLDLLDYRGSRGVAVRAVGAGTELDPTVGFAVVDERADDEVGERVAAGGADGEPAAVLER